MRLWSVHPKYLDKFGLMALWREGLLAQKILSGELVEGSDNEQLKAFKNHNNPIKAIGSYLCYVAAEGAKRGYKLTHEKILCPNFDDDFLSLSNEQLVFETNHLKNKLKSRNKQKLKEMKGKSLLEPNPVFGLIVDELMPRRKI